jgi:tetratricopeptide (TPR) repeat protein
MTAVRIQALCLPFFAVLLAAQEPAVNLDELLRSGRQSYSKGDFAAAAEFLQRAWKVVEARPSSEPSRYEVSKLMATVYSAGGRFADAENSLRIAIRWSEDAFGPRHPKVAEDLLSLAVLCQRSKEYAKGLTVMERVRDIHMKDGGSRNPLLDDDFSFTARLLMGQKEMEQAAALFQVAVDRRAARLGPEHPALLPDLDRLGVVLISLRQYEKAEEAYRTALNIRERSVPANDPDLIQTLDGLAYSCFGQKKLQEAEGHYKRLLAVWIASAGSDHPMVALTLDKLAVLYREQKMWGEAAAVAQRSRAIRALFFAGGLSMEGDIALVRGDRKDAARLYKDALAALDSSRPEHDELRKQLERNLKELAPAKAPPPLRKSSGSPAKDKASSSGKR